MGNQDKQHTRGDQPKHVGGNQDMDVPGPAFVVSLVHVAGGPRPLNGKYLFILFYFVYSTVIVYIIGFDLKTARTRCFSIPYLS